MTVSELIKKLRRCDPGAVVYIETRQCLEGAQDEICRVRKLLESELNDKGIESGVVIE